MGGLVSLPLKGGTFSENIEVTSQWWLSDSSLESQVEDRFHCEKCRASPAVTPYLWHIRSTQGQSEERSQLWLWQDFAGTVWVTRCCFIFSAEPKNVILRDCETSAQTLIAKVHIKDKKTQPSPESILHSFKRTQQNCHHKVEWHSNGLNTTLWCEKKRETCKMSVCVCLEKKRELINHLSSLQLISDSDKDKSKLGKSYTLCFINFHNTAALLN